MLGRLVTIEPLRADGVELVDEDDGRRLLARQCERVSHQLRSVADEHLHELGRGQLRKHRIGLGGTRSRHQRLACTDTRAQTVMDG